MGEDARIPEFSMVSKQYWPRIPWFDPVPDFYHWLDKVRKEKIIPILIDHYMNTLIVQQEFNQKLLENQKVALNKIKKMIG